MANYLICRIENYKLNQAIGVDHEKDHLEERGYNNPDWDKSKRDENISLEHDTNKDGKTLPEYIKQYREDNNIQGRMTTTGKEKSQTNVFTQCIITTSPEYIDSLNRQEQISFFKDGLKAFKEMYPTYHVVDATIHFDETTPHMHINSLPIYHNQEKDIWQFSTTKTQEGKFHYREFQDHMYNRLSRTYNIERGVQKEDREHLTKKEWQQLKDKEKSLDEREKGIQEKEKAVQERYNKYKDEIAPKKQFLGIVKYDKNTVDYLINGYNALVAENEKLRQENKDIKDKAISEIDKANNSKEQAIWERDLAIQERNKAIQIARTVNNDRERNKQLDRLEEYGIQPTHEKERNHERELAINSR